MTDWNSDDIPSNRTGGRRAAKPQPPRNPLDPPKAYVLPAGTPAGKCDGPRCGARIYWVRDGGRSVPVDCLGSGAVYPSVVRVLQRQLDLFAAKPERPRDGVGHAHLDRCPDAAFLIERARRRRQER